MNANVENIAAAGRETLETVVKMGTDATAEGYRNAAEFGNEQLDLAKSGYETAVAYGRDGLAAMSEAAVAAIEGWQSVNQGMIDYTRTATAENLDIAQRAFAVKTSQELVALQAEALNKSVGRVTAQSAEFNRIAA